MQKKILLITVLMLFTLGACSSKPQTTTDKKSIVVTSFIGYDIATKVGGDLVSVENILPWGSELHNFEPTGKNLTNIGNADLFISLGTELEPWSKNIQTKQELRLDQSYTVEEHDHDTHDEDEHDDHDHASLHFWTDPLTFIQLVEATRDELITIDSSNQLIYTENANKYIEEIQQLHLELDSFIQSVPNDRRTLYFAGHNAMDAFSNRYHIQIQSLSDEFTPDADMTAKQLQSLRDGIVENNVHYLFTEELSDPKVGNQIKTDLNKDSYATELLELHGYHNISKEQAEKGVSYADLFRQNIENIKKGMDH